MKEFLLILLLGRSILLTPEPVNISNQWIVIPIDNSITAINSGATLNVQLSVNGQLVTEIKKVDNHFKKLKELLPDETIEAVLSDKDGNQVKFTNTGFSISDSTFIRDDSVWITMKKLTGVVLNQKFSQLKIRSSIDIEKARIFWKNYSK